jgi:hypothetical protein
MSTDPEKFRINAVNYLNLEHAEFKQNLYNLALSKPSVYGALRAEVVKKVKVDAIGQMYNTFFNLLTKGNDAAGNNLVTSSTEGKTIFTPNVPMQVVNQFALNAAAQLEELCDKAVEMVCPLDYNKILSSRLAQVGALPTDVV